MAMSSCNDKKQQSNTMDDAWGKGDGPATEVPAEMDYSSSIKPQIQEMYDDIFRTQRTADGNYDPDQQYCTESYLELSRKAKKLSRAIGELGPMDYDHWTQGQDADNPEANVLNVEMTGENEAAADVEITDFGHKQSVRIIVKKEHGQWKVDDFITYYNGKTHSERKSMNDYINE